MTYLVTPLTDYPRAIWRPAHSYAVPIPRRIISAAILHSADGYLAGDLATLTKAGSVSAHYYVARNGTIWQLVREANIAFHVGKVRKELWSNAHTLGIEHEHIDHHDDWPDAQIFALARLIFNIRLRYPHLAILSHSEVCYPPGRKEDPVAYPLLALHVAIQRLNDAANHRPTLPA